MWIVQLALRRPLTFIVMALVIVLIVPLVLLRTPTDIFPEINIPVISVVWGYTGMQPAEIADRITLPSERSLTTLVNDVEHIESQSLSGIAVIKVFFRPSVNLPGAIAQVTAISQTLLRALPPGITPPLVVTYSASTIPIVQLGMSGGTLAVVAIGDDVYAATDVRAVVALRAAATKAAEDRARRGRPVDPERIVERGLVSLPSGTSSIE